MPTIDIIPGKVWFALEKWVSASEITKCPETPTVSHLAQEGCHESSYTPTERHLMDIGYRAVFSHMGHAKAKQSHRYFAVEYGSGTSEET